MTGHPIVFDRVTHHYGEFRALHSVSFEVEPGTIFALLGRNGAGKTTALRVLLGLLAPSRGRALLLDHDVARMPPRLRDRVGYVAEGQPLVPAMRVRDLVAFQADCFPSFDRVLCRRHLDRLRIPGKQRVARLSRGMRARTALALALAPRPDVVILDDPALGLDTVVRREFLETMIELIQEEGRTLLFTSHVLADVERVADRVAILHEGVLRVNAPLDLLRQRIRRWRLLFDGDAPATVPEVPGLVRCRRSTRELVMTLVDGEKAAAAAGRDLGARAVTEDSLTLEDLFVDYTAGREEATS